MNSGRLVKVGCSERKDGAKSVTAPTPKHEKWKEEMEGEDSYEESTVLEEIQIRTCRFTVSMPLILETLWRGPT